MLNTRTQTQTLLESVRADVGYTTPPVVQMELQITDPSRVY